MLSKYHYKIILIVVKDKEAEPKIIYLFIYLERFSEWKCKNI